MGELINTCLPWLHAGLVVLTMSGCRKSQTTAPETGGAETCEVITQEGDGGAYDSNVPMDTSARFVEVTDRSGVAFTYQNGEEAGHFSIVESLGGGIALCDYDIDGDPDLFITGGGEYGTDHDIHGRSPAFYRNEGNWTFSEVTEESGAKVAPYYSHGVAAGDWDSDGFPDLLITGYGGLLLYHNQGDGTFQEITEVAGLNDRLWSSSAAWGDVDRDGDLDLYVAHYADWSFDNHPFCQGPTPDQREVCAPRNFAPLPDVFYANNGDGTFRNASREVGLRNDGKGLGVVIADIDLDGDLDIYVCNDTTENFLYRNDGTGHFQEIGLISATSVDDRGIADGSMGVDLGDYNLDGLPDIWVANFERESFALYRNEGDCMFTHVSQSTGVTAVGGIYVGWGTVFFDFDRDADEDIFVSNGHVVRYPLNASLRQTPLLLENHDGTRFDNVARAAGQYTDSTHMGRGVAVGDVDNDGDLDLAVSHTNEPVALLSNESENSNQWIALKLVGTRSSRDPVGAVVHMETKRGNQIRQVKGGTSYASSNDPQIFFGVKEADTIVSFEIHWPSGVRQTLSGEPANRTLTVIEPMRQ